MPAWGRAPPPRGWSAPHITRVPLDRGCVRDSSSRVFGSARTQTLPRRLLGCWGGSELLPSAPVPSVTPPRPACPLNAP